MDLAAAVAATVESRFAPTQERLAKVRAALDAFEIAERARVTSTVTLGVLATLGQQAAAADDEAAAAQAAAIETLRDAVAELLAPPEPATVAPKPAAVVVETRGKRPANIVEIERAETLIDEISHVDTTENHIRLLPHLRALTCEVRALMTPLSPTSETHGRLGDALRSLWHLRKKAGITQHVHGLEISQIADWGRLADQHRRAVEKYDRDARAPLKLVNGGGR